MRFRAPAWAAHLGRDEQRPPCGAAGDFPGSPAAPSHRAGKPHCIAGVRLPVGPTGSREGPHGLLKLQWGQAVALAWCGLGPESPEGKALCVCVGGGMCGRSQASTLAFWGGECGWACWQRGGTQERFGAEEGLNRAQRAILFRVSPQPSHHEGPLVPSESFLLRWCPGSSCQP